MHRSLRTCWSMQYFVAAALSLSRRFPEVADGVGMIFACERMTLHHDRYAAGIGFHVAPSIPFVVEGRTSEQHQWPSSDARNATLETPLDRRPETLECLKRQSVDQRDLVRNSPVVQVGDHIRHLVHAVRSPDCPRFIVVDGLKAEFELHVKPFNGVQERGIGQLESALQRQLGSQAYTTHFVEQRNGSRPVHIEDRIEYGDPCRAGIPECPDLGVYSAAIELGAAQA